MLIRQLDGSMPSAAHAPEGVATFGARNARPVPAPSADPPAAPSRHDAESAIAQANRALRSVAPSLEFELDPDTKTVVIRLVDRVDRQILRQVPSPEMLDIARALERMQTLLLRHRA